MHNMTNHNTPEEQTINPAIMEQVDPFLRFGEVAQITGLSKSTIRRLVHADQFPKPVHLSTNTRLWPLSEVKTWMATQRATRT